MFGHRVERCLSEKITAPGAHFIQANKTPSLEELPILYLMLSFIVHFTKLETNRINSWSVYTTHKEANVNARFDLVYSFTYIMTDIHTIVLEKMVPL